MKKTRFFLFVAVLMLLVFILTACVQKASTPQPNDAGEYPTVASEGTQSPMDVLWANATQTAQAAMGGDQAEQPAEGEAAAPEGEETAPEGETAPDGEASVPEGETETEGETAAPEDEAEAPAEQPSGSVKDEYDIPDRYTLHAGEFPFCIARRFNISPDALMSASGLSGSNFYPGTELVIPKDAASFNGQRMLRNHPASYTVQSGDTLYSIACLYGDVDPRAIADNNGISVDASLTPGQTLQIP